MRLLLLLTLSAALTAGADAADGAAHHRAKRGVTEYITNLIYKASDIVFRSFAEASGYKVTKVPPKVDEKSYSEEHSSGKSDHHSSGKSNHHSSGKSDHHSHTKEKKTHFATTTERVVTLSESYNAKEAPHHHDFKVYVEDDTSHYDKWSHKSPDHHEEEHHHGFDSWAKKSEQVEDESKMVKKKRPKISRIKVHRKGEEEKEHFRHVDKRGPNLGLSGRGAKTSQAEESRTKKPMIIRVLTPAPSKEAEASLEDSWPSVWRGAH